MMTPEQLRVAYHADASANPAVAAFRAFLTSGKAAEDAYFAWLAAPITQLVTRAIEELADNPPLAADSGDVALQYGVTSGLQLAAKLMTQPRRLYPEVFHDAQPADDGALEKAFTTNADAAIDNM